MKKIISLLLALCTVLTICGCMANTEDGEAHGDSTTSTTGVSDITDTDTEATASDAPQSTESPTTDTTPTFSPYTVKINRDNYPVYNGPGYEYELINTVGEVGVYTIVEEATEVEGRIWGKLKSGAGWVDLTLLNAEENGIVTADHADEKLLASENYHYFTSDPSASAIKIAFFAHVNLEDVSFYSVDLSQSYARGPELFRIPAWKPSQPFVANVPFSGSMSAYGLSFSYGNGYHYDFTVMTSGKDGSIILLPTPATDTSDITLPQLTMLFCSGAGGWFTELKLKEDGTFSGFYRDSDMGDAGAEYPNGTVYYCEFEGNFTITERTENAIHLRMPNLTEKPTPAEKWIEDGTLYVSSHAYGLEGGETFTLYLPSTPIDTLPEDALWWGEMNGFLKKTDTVTTYHILYCVETGNTFF